LILVLVVIVLLTLAAYTFSDLMVTERKATLVHGDQAQARAFVESGVDMVRLYLAQDEATRLESGGHLDNINQFQGVLVVDDEDQQRRGRVAVMSPYVDAYGFFDGIRYGLEDESARLNLSALVMGDQIPAESARQLLLAFSGMNEDIADAILDWIDEDSEPREFGAESEYYSALQPPYAPRNGPLETVEELLLVRGVTPELLYGLDANRNGAVDPHEQQQALTTTVGGTSLQLDRGWSAYLTLYSAERNVNRLGEPRINVNGEDLEQLHADVSSVFDADTATFIVAYRQNGPYQGGGSDSSGGGGGGGQNGQTPAVAGGGAFGSGGFGRGDGGRGGQGGGGDGPRGGGQGGGGPGGGGPGGGGPDGQGGGRGDGPGGGDGAGGADRGPGGGAGGGGRGGGDGGGGGGRGGGGGGGRGGGGGGGGRGGGGGAAGDGGGQNDAGEPVDGRKVDLTQPAGNELSQVLDLIGARVQVTFDGDREPTVLASPFSNDPAAMQEFLPLLDNLTEKTESVIPGRVNVNQAPVTVLMSIPGMDEEIVERIVTTRNMELDAANAARGNETWLLAEGIVTLEQMKSLSKYVTAGGDVFRAQVVGYYESGDASARAEVVIDATVPLPRVLLWKELGHLGRGFTLDALGAGLGAK
jgi:DNA uptake protein ComE-like DNA-binding protein